VFAAGMAADTVAVGTEVDAASSSAV